MSPSPGVGPSARPPTRRLASFGQRLGAFLLDGLLYGLATLSLMIPGIVILIDGLDGLDDCTRVGDELFCADGAIDGGLTLAGLGLMALAYLIVVVIYVRALGRTGQTWGRKIVGIRVLDVRTAQPLGVGRALGRQLFAQYISAGVFYLGYLWMLWDPDNETWHDKIVSSTVVQDD